MASQPAARWRVLIVDDEPPGSGFFQWLSSETRRSRRPRDAEMTSGSREDAVVTPLEPAGPACEVFLARA